MKSFIWCFVFLFGFLTAKAQTSETRYYNGKYNKKTALTALQNSIEKQKMIYDNKSEKYYYSYQVVAKKSDYDFILQWTYSAGLDIVAKIRYEIQDDFLKLSYIQVYVDQFLGSKLVITPNHTDKDLQNIYQYYYEVYITKVFEQMGLTENKSQSTSDNSNNFQDPSNIQSTVNQWLNNCSNDMKCVAKKFDEWFIDTKKSESKDQLYQKSADVFTALYNENNHYPFQVLLKVSNETMDSYDEFKKRIPEQILIQIKNSAQGVVDGYQKHINSEETRKMVEEKGGGYY